MGLILRGIARQQEHLWYGEQWRPFVKNNGGYLIPGNKPIPPQFTLSCDNYLITGLMFPSSHPEQPGFTLLTIQFRNTTGFQFSLQGKPKVVKVAEWFGSNVGVNFKNGDLHEKILLKSNDHGLAKQIFAGAKMSEQLLMYHKALTYQGASRIEINPNSVEGSISQLGGFYNWVLIDRLQRAVDLMGLILQRMTEAGVALPL